MVTAHVIATLAMKRLDARQGRLADEHVEAAFEAAIRQAIALEMEAASEVHDA
jgi:hypothetical protein